jgi:hypothetical protein
MTAYTPDAEDKCVQNFCRRTWRRDSLGMTRCRWEDVSEVCLEGIRREAVASLHLALNTYGMVVGFVNRVMNVHIPQKCGKIIFLASPLIFPCR